MPSKPEDRAKRHAERMAADPEYRERLRTNAREGQRRRYRDDPEYRERKREQAKKYGRLRREEGYVPKPRKTHGAGAAATLKQCEGCGRLRPGGACNCEFAWEPE